MYLLNEMIVILLCCSCEPNLLIKMIQTGSMLQCCSISIIPIHPQLKHLFFDNKTS